jgi:hypothetical protein
MQTLHSFQQLEHMVFIKFIAQDITRPKKLQRNLKKMLVNGDKR